MNESYSAILELIHVFTAALNGEIIFSRGDIATSPVSLQQRSPPQ
jgi:hypothetical protein